MSQPSQEGAPPSLGVMGQAMSETDRRDVESIIAIQNSLLGNSQAMQLLVTIQSIIMLVGSWGSISLEVFSRHSFGERYLTPLRVFLGFVVMMIFTLGLSAVGALITSGIPQQGLAPNSTGRQFLVMLMFAAAYVGMAFWHLFNNFYRSNYTNDVWHSQSFGIPRLEWLLGARIMALPPINDWHLYLYIEPALWFLAGNLLLLFGQFLPTGTLGRWVLFCSFVLLIKNQIVYYREREQQLDLMDAQIKAANTTASARGASKRDTAGVSAIVLPRAVDRNRDGKVDVMSTPTITPGMFTQPAQDAADDGKRQP